MIITPAIVKRNYELLRSERSNIESLWDVVERFVMPFRGRMFQTVTGENSVDWSTRDVYDSTAIIAAQNLASALQSAMTPAAIKWFEMAFEDAALNKDLEAMRWLENSGNTCFQALQDSNFNLESNETYLDLVGFGSSVIVEEAENEDEWDGLLFQSIPIKECFFEEDTRGRVIRLYRKLNWTVSQIVDKFGIENVPMHISECYKNNAPKAIVEKHDVIFCVFKRNGDTGYPLTPESRPVGKMYVLLKTSEMIGKEGGYYEMPAFVPKWRRTNDSKWGHSPAMLAISDILTLNKLVELILAAAEKVVDPTTLTTERGLLTDLNLGAGEVAVVRNVEDVKAYESKSRFDVSELQREKLQDQINRSFYVDQLQLKQSPAMTAQEVMARMEMMQRLLGPTLARMQNDFLDPLIQRTFNILYRAGQIDSMPEIVKAHLDKRRGVASKPVGNVVPLVASSRKSQNIRDLKITYVSPLYIAQRASHVNSVQQWVALLGAMAGIPGAEEVMDIPNLKNIARGSGKMLGVPLEMVNSEKEAKAVGDARKQALEQQRALQAIETLGGATKDLASARAVAQ